MRIIPSNNENSLWTCRWTKESDIGRPPSYPPPRQAQAVEVGNLKTPIFPKNICGPSHHFFTASLAQNLSSGLVQSTRNGINRNDETVMGSDHICRPQIEYSDIFPDKCQRVLIPNRKVGGELPESQLLCHQTHNFARRGIVSANMRLAGENPRSVAFAGHSNKRHPIRKNFILQQDPIQILHGESRLKIRHSKIKGDNITCCSRFRELQPSPTLLHESQIVLPAALFQRLEPFEETSRFFRPSDDTTEAFVVNGPLIDFAIRSTWA